MCVSVCVCGLHCFVCLVILRLWYFHVRVFFGREIVDTLLWRRRGINCNDVLIFVNCRELEFFDREWKCYYDGAGEMSFPDNCTPTTGSIVPDAPMHMNNSCVRLYSWAYCTWSMWNMWERDFSRFFGICFFLLVVSSRVFSQILLIFPSRNNLGKKKEGSVVVVVAAVSWGVYIGFRLLGHWPLKGIKFLGFIFECEIVPSPNHPHYLSKWIYLFYYFLVFALCTFRRVSRKDETKKQKKIWQKCQYRTGAYFCQFCSCQ